MYVPRIQQSCGIRAFGIRNLRVKFIEQQRLTEDIVSFNERKSVLLTDAMHGHSAKVWVSQEQEERMFEQFESVQ
jgi:hypothetical protein